VLPAVYPDSYITERLNSFFKAAKVSKETIGIGDTVTLDIKGTIDGKVFEDGTVSNFMCVIGEGNLNEDFESNLIGHSLNERFEFTLTLSEDYDDTLAGKEVLYSVKVKDIYNDNEIIQNATGFANMWELKYALRVESYISYALVTYVEDQSNLISYPEKLLKRFEKIFENYVRRDVAERVLEYAEYGYSYTKKEMRALIYPDGADVTYIEEGSKAAAYSYLIAVAIQRELGLEYSEKDYNRDLKLIAEEYTTYYEETYTTKDIVSLYGEEVLYTSFLVAFLTEHLMERVSGMPKIPG
ncbi:MAG: FKBP-type peptidyl-prolyl cis-trans isomerase, partial [Clostridia bacterium]|nr:FKBP-type peptidyl-prolyl cis-trans isomerase [Clostridia bacterium]